LGLEGSWYNEGKKNDESLKQKGGGVMFGVWCRVKKMQNKMRESFLLSSLNRTA
jgi:hypothetical protein